MNDNKHYGSKYKIIIIDSDMDALLIRPMKIAKSLANNGYQVEFLVWDRHCNKNKEKKNKEYKINNFCYKPLNNTLCGLVTGYFLWWIYVFIFLLQKEADIYHCMNIYNFFPIIFVKIIKKKKAIFDILDFSADSRNWPKMIKKFLSDFENFCIRFADEVIIVDDCRRGQIHSAYIKKTAVVMNCPKDITDGKPIIKKKNKEFTIYYGGWISETRGIEHICNSVKGFNDVKLIVAGFGPDVKKFEKIFDNQNNIEYRGLLSFDESIKINQNADLIFAFYDPKIKINTLASPNKLFDSMMCSTPILTNSEAISVVNIIYKEKCGIYAPYNDINAIRKSIDFLKSNPNIALEMGKNGRIAFEKKYNWNKMEKRLLNLYSKII